MSTGVVAATQTQRARPAPVAPGDGDPEGPVALADLAVRAARAYDRPDLAASFTRARSRLAHPGARVVFLGDVKQGKSALVNALVGAAVCPVRDDVATRVPTVVHHAPSAGAALVGGEHRRTVTPAEAAAAVATTDPATTDAWSHAEIGLPHGLVADGLVVVDTPGSGGSASSEALVRGELAAADAAVLVTDASRALTAGEVALLREAAARCAVVLVALTRTDLAPRWREVRDLDRAALAAAGLDVDVVGVSAQLHRRAQQEADPAGAASLAAEAGVDALAATLRRRVADPSGARTTRGVLAELVEGVGEMSAALAAERDALADPAHAAALAADLTAARDRAAALRERSARWAQTLNDGVADLTSDIDWDLRDRMRHVLRAAEDALEGTDPAASWPTFAPWFADQVAEAVATTFTWAGERTWTLAERVAAHFGEDDGEVRTHLPGPAPHEITTSTTAGGVPATVPGGRAVRAELPDLGELATPDLERIGLGHGLVVGMRGSYGGVLMVGMITTLSGLALVNPFSVGAGVLLGSKTVRDERKRALARRRTEAKTAARRHADEALHLAGKRSRDMLRDVQRTLRDHFTGRAETLTRSVADAVTAASAAQEIATTARDRRLRDVRAELGRVGALLEQLEAADRAPGGEEHR